MITEYCVACHFTDDLHNHHVLPRSLGGTDEETNLITLCSTCHRNIHGNPYSKAVNHSELTKAGLRRAKARGVKLGKPSTPEQRAIRRVKGNKAVVANANKFATDLAPAIIPMRQNGDSFADIAKWLNDKGVTTQRNKDWTPDGVRNVLNRLDIK